MDEWTEIRRKVLMEGVSKRSIRRDYRNGSEAPDKILAHSEPPGYRMAGPRPKPVLGPFLGVIDEILEADKTAPPKQRHTGRRIFERLHDEYGYEGGSTQVRVALAQARRHFKEAFGPLSHPPGHAQFDFGEATVEIAGVRHKAALRVITRPRTSPGSRSSAACRRKSPLATEAGPAGGHGPWALAQLARHGHGAGMDLALLAGSASTTLASGIAGHLGIKATTCTTERFPDGEGHVLVGPVRGCDVYVVQSTGPPVDAHVLELALIADACRRAGAARLTAVVPYFGYARHDRRTRSGEAVGVRIVGDILAGAGLQQAVVVDPHVPALEAILPMPTEVISAWDVLTQALRSEVSPDAVVVAPDEGAVKLADRVASSLALPLALVRKCRLSGEHVSVTEVVGDVRDRPMVLVDDMISTGGTISAAIAALLERGAAPDAVIAAPHGLLVGPVSERLANLPVRHLFLSDTLPVSADAPCRTTVVSVASHLAEAVARLHHGPPSMTVVGAVRPAIV